MHSLLRSLQVLISLGTLHGHPEGYDVCSPYGLMLKADQGLRTATKRQTLALRFSPITMLK